MKRYRVLVLVHKALVPDEHVSAAEVTPEWRMEWDVVTTLRKRGHELLVIGVHDDLTPIRRAIEEFEPTIVFNLLEEFADRSEAAAIAERRRQQLPSPPTATAPVLDSTLSGGTFPGG